CLVGRADWLRAAEPYLFGGGATASVGDQVVWSADPQARHEAGTPNVLGVVALAAACEALTDWDTLIAEEERLLTRLRAGLAAIPGVRELSLWGDLSPRVGIVSFVVDGRLARDVATELSEKYGIGLRDGKFCAHPFLRRLLGEGAGGCDTDDGTALRASFGIGTTDEHIDRLLTALRRLGD
ncbi:aminotransferase class V-fold PLP-dependent enzyme, partial [Actinoallomurus acaciae]